MKESIPPTIRPERVEPINVAFLSSELNLQHVSGKLEGSITGISMNTSDLRPGDLFVAMPGLKTHGAKFAGKALELGAVAIVTDSAGLPELSKFSAPVLLLESPREHLGILAAFVYG
ncbi:MAG: hypothetical protein RL389_36, partial [Actinomycetota bacterium]